MRELSKFVADVSVIIAYAYIARLSVEVMIDMMLGCDSVYESIPIMLVITLWVLILLLGAMFVLAILIEPPNKKR